MIDKVKYFFNFFINNEMSSKAVSLLWRVLFATIILILMIQIVKIFKKFLSKTLKKFKVDDDVSNFLISLSSAVIYIVFAFFIAQGLGVDAASIVALLGSLGVTIGLAIQGSLANIAGGVLILLLKPFKIGDYIIEDTNMNEGKVLEIGLIYTKLLTVDCKTVILPNGILANASIVNVTHTPLRMVELFFDVSYDTDIVLAKKLILDVIKNDASVLSEKPIEIVMESWEASSIKLNARFYVNNKDYRNTKCRVLENVKISFDMNNIEIPFPQVVVHES